MSRQLIHTLAKQIELNLSYQFSSLHAVKGIGWQVESCDWLLFSSNQGLSSYYYSPLLIMYDRGVRRYIIDQNEDVAQRYFKGISNGIIHLSHLKPQGISLVDEKKVSIFVGECVLRYAELVSNLAEKSRYKSMAEWVRMCSPQPPAFVTQSIDVLAEGKTD
jgi:hypothetical protein